MMRSSLVGLAMLCSGATAATPATPDWNNARRVEVRLSSFDYTPSTIQLRGGQPVILHLVNVAGGGHNFAAKQFFAAALIKPQDRAKVASGEVELRGRQSQDIALVPKAGRYRLKCTHTLHATLGMKGEIVVS